MKKLKKNISETKNKPSQETPDVQCAVCWGFQEYDGEQRVLFEDKQRDVNNHLKKYMRIQKFLKTYLDGIKFKEPEIHTCTNCGRKTTK